MSIDLIFISRYCILIVSVKKQKKTNDEKSMKSLKKKRKNVYSDK